MPFVMTIFLPVESEDVAPKSSGLAIQTGLRAVHLHGLISIAKGAKREDKYVDECGSQPVLLSL